MSGQAVKLKVSKPTAECISPSAPKDMRMMAASGKLPVEPSELVVALYILANDKDTDIRKEAQKSLRNIPEHILKSLLASSEINPRVLDYISRIFSKDTSILEIILQNSNIDIKTLERITSSADEKLLELICSQKKVILKNPSIFDVIKKNPNIRADLVVQVGTLIEEGIQEDEDNEGDLPEEFTKEKDEAEPEEEQKEGSLYSQILEMGTSMKIKLAITGNKEARSILVKEPNRLICGNVMKNPRITDSEVVMFSASKSVGEEVFRLILGNREWMKNYQVKLNIVSNPRAPLPAAMNLLSHLRDKDLELMSKSRNVSKAISNQAKRMLSAKKAEKKKK